MQQCHKHPPTPLSGLKVRYSHGPFFARIRYIHIDTAHILLVSVGLAQARPNYSPYASQFSTYEYTLSPLISNIPCPFALRPLQHITQSIPATRSHSLAIHISVVNTHINNQQPKLHWSSDPLTTTNTGKNNQLKEPMVWLVQLQ